MLSGGQCVTSCRAILPVPGAFAQTGAVCSTVFMVLTAAANVYTSDLLFWQAFATRRHDYESLSIATGGRILKVHGLRNSFKSPTGIEFHTG